MPSKPLAAIKPMFKHGTWRVVEGDLVQILAGKDKGKQGKVLKVIKDERFPRVVVENLNIVSRPSRVRVAAAVGAGGGVSLRCRASGRAGDAAPVVLLSSRRQLRHRDHACLRR
jgi:hypothetical protein